MAARIVGNQAVFRNQMSVPVVSNATIASRIKARPKVAFAKAAMPAGVNGCQAKLRRGSAVEPGWASWVAWPSLMSAHPVHADGGGGSGLGGCGDPGVWGGAITQKLTGQRSLITR